MTQTDVPSAAGMPAAEPDLTGRTLGDYQLLRRLGQGGMGQVYLAEQSSLKRKVALKILKADLAANPTYLQRFKAEAEAVARATHANIVQVYAIGEADGLHFMALEYVEGRNLRDYLAKKGPPELPLALAIMRQVAAALLRAGELGIIHRDIKPENILLTRKGEVKVADFGLARSLSGPQPLNLTQSGVTLGTPLYMSPEQVQGLTLDPRTDMYSFGVTCFHMLAGRPPFRGETAFQVALQHVQAQAPLLQTLRPDLPGELCAVVQKMMAKKPEERYQTPRELLRDIARLREVMTGAIPAQTGVIANAANTGINLAAATGTAEVTPPPRAGRLRRRVLMAAAVLAGLGAGALCAVLAHQKLDPAPGPMNGGELASADAVGDPALASLFSLRKREQVLRDAVEQYSHPGNEKTKIDIGLGLCVELALLYLEQYRFDEAEQLFARLDALTPPVKAYKYLSQLGRALVLAFQDKPEASNKLFEQCLVGKPPDQLEAIQFLRPYPKLREMIALALEHNRQNDKLPQALDRFRKPNPLRPDGQPARKPGPD